MARIKMHIPKAKLPFYPPCEVKCRLQNGVLTLTYQVNSANNRCDLPMELTEDQYYASKDENMDKLPNFRKFVAYYTLRNSFLV